MEKQARAYEVLASKMLDNGIIIDIENRGGRYYIQARDHDAPLDWEFETDYGGTVRPQSSGRGRGAVRVYLPAAAEIAARHGFDIKAQSSEPSGFPNAVLRALERLTAPVPSSPAPTVQPEADLPLIRRVGFSADIAETPVSLAILGGDLIEAVNVLGQGSRVLSAKQLRGLRSFIDVVLAELQTTSDGPLGVSGG